MDEVALIGDGRTISKTLSIYSTTIKNIAEELQKADDDLKEFFKEEFAKMLKRTNIREEIECKLPYGEENRVDYIIEMIKKLS